MKNIYKYSITATIVFLLSICVYGQRIELNKGWRMLSDVSSPGIGEKISLPGYNTSTWYPISSLPATVLAVLEENEVYTDLYYGKNLDKVPALWKQNWWYRLEFDAPSDREQYWLDLRGINYRADVYLNGVLLGAKKDIVGTYRHFKFNVTNEINAGGANAMAIKIYPEQSESTDLGIFWNDWVNFSEFGKTPDHSAGIWQRVYLEMSGNVQIRNPLANTDLPLPSTSSADITVYADLVNGSSISVSGTLSGVISRTGKADITFQQDVTIPANETLEVSFNPEKYSQLDDVANPDLWGPYTLGEPNLYQLELKFKVDEVISDVKTINFGIREVERGMYNHYQYFKFNGQNYLVRGANYTPDLLLNVDEDYEQAVINYIKDLGLNLIRWEAKMGSEHMYDLADKEGIPIMLGWMCCGEWEDFSNWDSEDYYVAKQSMRSQIKDVRHRPSMLQWAHASDGIPPLDLLSDYKDILKELHYQNTDVNTVSDFNEARWDGIHMRGPYSWIPANMWYSNFPNGDGNVMAEGFCAEQGMNEIVPPYESLKKYIPQKNLSWPIRNPELDSVWAYHAGTNGDNLTLKILDEAITAHYGSSNSTQEFVKKAQVDQYELTRSHMESFPARGWNTHKGTLYWMLNNHWPGTFGHIFGYYLKPGGAYYGIKKGTRPLTVVFDQYDSGDGNSANFYVTNQTLKNKNNLKVVVKYYNIDLAEKYSNEVTEINVDALSGKKVMQLGRLDELTSTYFVRLWLKDENDNVLAENFYWQSTQPDIISNYDVFGVTMKQYADYTALNDLPMVDLDVSNKSAISDGEETVIITLTNNSNSLAFFTRVEILRGPNGEEVKPIIYNDNYVSLFPSEAIDIIAKYKTSDLHGKNVFIHVEGYNVNKAQVNLNMEGTKK